MLFEKSATFTTTLNPSLLNSSGSVIVIGLFALLTNILLSCFRTVASLLVITHVSLEMSCIFFLFALKVIK